MPDPMQAVVVDGAVTTVAVMDAATAEAWTADGTAGALWPGGELVDVTDVDPQPGPGWAYDGKRFTAPPQPEPEQSIPPQPEPAADEQPAAAPAAAPAAKQQPAPTKGGTT